MEGISILDIVIPLAGGLGLFLYGMQLMSDGLQNAAGSKMKKLLEALTNNKLMGVFVGTLITGIIQSSSATTVMVVGFVNAGIMNLSQAMGVIMGANIGTTVRAWIVSSSEWAKFLNPTYIAPVAILVGVVIIMFSKKAKYKDIATIIVGFGLLFIGINFMSDSVYVLRDSETLKSAILTLGQNPFMGVLAGAAITAIIQSSSASVGILQTLAIAGLVNFDAAIFIIMGQNIGTCITAMISAIGTSKNAKCAAYMHLLFNIIGTLIFGVMVIVYLKIIAPQAGNFLITATQIGLVHTVFNIANTMVLYPFSDKIISLAKVLTRNTVEEADETKLVHLDDRVLETPSFAVESAKLETIRFGRVVQKNIYEAIDAIFEKDEEKIKSVIKREEKIDKISEGITQYLVKIYNTHINERENIVVTSLLKVVSDMERVSDHCENLAELTTLMINEETSFSDTARKELRDLVELAAKSYVCSVDALETGSIDSAREVVRIEDMIDDMEAELRTSHIHRLANNECKAAAGIVFLDTLTNMERISDHALNIAQSVLEGNREERKLKTEEKN